jgi:hypothetical protein
MSYWPWFHDAEVISVTLERAFPFQSGVSIARLKVLVREYAPAQVGSADFHMAFKRGALISFLFQDVGEILLEDFNHQNVINKIAVTASDLKNKRLKVEVESIFGVGGHFYCNSVEIEHAKELTADAL